MADYHVLTADHNGNAFTVAAHFPVPDQVNDVGYNYRAALVESLGGPPVVSAVPFITAAEQRQLDDGELYERVYSLHSHPGETLLQKRDRLDLQWPGQRDIALQELIFKLSLWGYSRDVP